MFTPTLRRLVPICLLGFVAACGQPGDDPSSLPAEDSLENAPPGIIVLDEDAPLPADFVIQSLTAAEQSSMLSAVNAKRTRGTTCGTTAFTAAPALVTNSKLVSAAETHAADMASRNYFSHYTKGTNADPGKRITATGYRWQTYAENIAAGQTSIAAAVDGWYKSEGHCRNFMNKTLTQAGFGKGYSASAAYKYYWVAVMAKPL